MVHAIPIPRNTLTALEPVTLPTEASAYGSPQAATLLAKVSEKYVKKKVMKCCDTNDMGGGAASFFKSNPLSNNYYKLFLINSYYITIIITIIYFQHVQSFFSN